MIKKFLSLLMAVIIASMSFVCVNAVSIDEGIDALCEEFGKGKGSETNGYTIDYTYYSPAKKGDTTKYPLVVWLHGMGDGSSEGRPLYTSNISYWSSDEFQARFKPAGGAYIFIPRSLEEKNNFWGDDLIEPLRATIDQFIKTNKKNIDLSRIYIGGYSMGGKMTLKMAVAYPEMFAAAFPICPAWAPTADLLENIKDMPVWLTSSKRDPLVNYYFAVSPTWNTLISVSNVAEDCRFSTMGRVCKEDGTKTSSNHHAWFAINHDLFNSENGDYPNMSTVNGIGEEVKLTYPDGMISWLSMQTSDYNGDAGVGTGKLDITTATGRMIAADNISDFFKLLWNAIVDVFSF